MLDIEVALKVRDVANDNRVADRARELNVQMTPLAEMADHILGVC